MAQPMARSPSEANIQEFKELTKKRAVESLQRELDRLVMTGKTQDDKDIATREFEGFLNVFRQYISMERTTIDWEKIQPLPEGTLRHYNEISVPTPDMSTCKNLLSKLVVIKLNGGLGTSMGCKGPKSVIPVRSDLTFLDLTIQQIEVFLLSVLFAFLLNSSTIEYQQTIWCGRSTCFDEFVQY